LAGEDGGWVGAGERIGEEGGGGETLGLLNYVNGKGEGGEEVGKRRTWKLQSGTEVLDGTGIAVLDVEVVEIVGGRKVVWSCVSVIVFVARIWMALLGNARIWVRRERRKMIVQIFGAMVEDIVWDAWS
jgi:hypothetical protein